MISPPWLSRQGLGDCGSFTIKKSMLIEQPVANEGNRLHSPRKPRFGS